ncbi:MAG: hypothetical protein Q9208_007600 [Pyrenodesmia sp. 3 TL-2023]
MTDSLRAPIESLNYNDTQYTYLTAPSSSPNSINNLTDAEASADACRSTLIVTGNVHNLNNYDAVLVACYSPHPLMPLIQAWGPTFPAIGIFEASISVSLQLLAGSGKKFGIVSTGVQWQAILGDAIRAKPGTSGAALGEEMADAYFAGVECVGVSAGELHPEGGKPEGVKGEEDGHGESSTRREEGSKGDEEGGIKEKVRAATGRLLERGDVGVIVLGCAGMVGMEAWVKEEVARRGKWGVRVVDGVLAGVGVLQGLLRGRFREEEAGGTRRRERLTERGGGVREGEGVMQMQVKPMDAAYQRQLQELGEENRKRLKRAREEGGEEVDSLQHLDRFVQGADWQTR